MIIYSHIDLTLPVHFAKSKMTSPTAKTVLLL